MSVQFGKCNFDGRYVDPKDLDQVRPVLAPYGPDGEGHICQDNLGVLYRAFYTTKESRSEVQPHVSISGAVITWDGRLDNREELMDQIGREVSAASSDLAIVAAAYERWGTNSFAKLIGDWALSIWDPKDRSILLAKDFAGARHLYYSVEKDQATWCTILDPLVLFAGRSFKLEEEYLAGWLSSFPAPHLTPYAGIQAVPPSSFVRLTSGAHKVCKYWEFEPAKRILYRMDSEYEEHFRTVFAGAVRRRLRSDSPLLAELSGGMDSSSIVCMADRLVKGLPASLRVDTISYYDDSEPNWDERPYFTKVEQKRGRTGLHIDVGPQSQPGPRLDSTNFVATPSSVRRPSQASTVFSEYMASRGYRVLLSGVGGDEVTGGVPTPIPEIQDLIATARLKSLAHQLKAWALTQRKPWVHLLFDALRGFVPGALAGIPKHKGPAAWLHPELVKRNGTTLRGHEDRMRLFGPLPSFQENLSTLDGLRRQLSCTLLAFGPPCEVRCPFLDRDLLEFLYGVPRQQIVRPGRRRSLMRRALIGIVPDEILDRRRKAFVTRSAAAAASHEYDSLADEAKSFAIEDLGVVDGKAFREALQQLRTGQELPIVTFMRTLACELWLRGVAGHLAGLGARQQSTTLDPRLVRPESTATGPHIQIRQLAG